MIETTKQCLDDIEFGFDASAVADGWDDLGPDGRRDLVESRDPQVALAGLRLVHLAVVPALVTSETGRIRLEQRRRACVRAFDEGYLIGRLALGDTADRDVSDIDAGHANPAGAIADGPAFDRAGRQSFRRRHPSPASNLDELLTILVAPTVRAAYTDARAARSFVNEIVTCTQKIPGELAAQFGGNGFVAAVAASVLSDAFGVPAPASAFTLTRRDIMA